MTQDACDAAYPPGNIDAEMSRLGVGPIGRYLTAPGDTRGVTRVEIERHLAAGHPTLVFDEVGNGDRWRGGYPAGFADGQAARVHAGNVNWHDVIFNAYDTAVPPNQLAVAAEYQRGHNDGLGHGWMPFGAYGGNNLLVHLYSLGLITYGVSANASSWHYGVPRPAWCQWQQGYQNPPPIPSTDPGWVFSDDYGQYPSPVQHVPQEDIVTPEDIEKVAQRVAALLADPTADAGKKYLEQVSSSVHFQVSGQKYAEAEARGEGHENWATIGHVGEDAWFRVSGRAQIEAAARGEAVGTGNNKGWPTIAEPQVGTA